MFLWQAEQREFQQHLFCSPLPSSPSLLLAARVTSPCMEQVEQEDSSDVKAGEGEIGISWLVGLILGARGPHLIMFRAFSQQCTEIAPGLQRP